VRWYPILKENGIVALKRDCAASPLLRLPLAGGVKSRAKERQAPFKAGCNTRKINIFYVKFNRK
jgi:hypothetical protein